MIRFGPAGNSQSFYNEGFKHTKQAAAWLKERGLNAFEYSFGRGVRLKEETGRDIAAEFDANGIAMSVHAPYYINFCTDDLEKREASINFLLQAMRAGTYLNAKRTVFHPGSCSKMDRETAKGYAMEAFKEALERIKAEGLIGLPCPETMGKINQFGTLDEVLELCTLREDLVPTIDFGHLDARGIGAIKGRADYEAILDAIENKLGRDRLRMMHVHFSKIEHTRAGEKRHVTFADEGFTPDFLPLAELLAERDLTPVVICESAGTQAEDALTMKEMYESFR